MHMLMWFQTKIKVRDATKMSHTHERIETKIYELVYKGSKSHGLIYHSHLAHIINIHMPAKVLRNQMVNFAFNQVNAQNRIHS